MNFKVTLLLLFVISASASAQLPEEPSNWNTDVEGPVKSVEFVRVYVRMGGRNIGEKRVPIYTERYNESGDITELIKYGEDRGYARTIYTRGGDKPIAQITYFDPSGNQISETSPEFKKKSSWSDEAGLCSQYTIRHEVDSLARINRTYETCPDGSNRSTTIDELDLRGNLTRQVRTDAKGRVGESRIDYGLAGNILEFRYSVSGVPKPYVFTMNYMDVKQDPRGNWIRMTATAVHSTRPDELLFQYNETRSITYYDELKPRN